MDQFLLSYNSPLFSVLLAILILLAMMLVTYGWSLYVQRKRKSQLMEFLEKFEGDSCVLDGTDIPYDESMSKPLLLLAKAFEASGEYHKSIGIYLYLIKNEKHEEMMEQLGKVYLKAGLLKHAQDIFEQILSRNPREISTLYQLGMVYEQMQEYDKAMDTIEPLRTLGEEVDELEGFWQFEKLQKNESIPRTEKITILKNIILQNPKLYKIAISSLFRISYKDGWREIDPNRIGDSLDMLWYLPSSQLDFDIISANMDLQKIYFVRGDIAKIEDSALQNSSGIASIDILAAARSTGQDRGGLSFAYICSSCEQIFPIAFKRCHNCMAINSARVEEQISKDEKADYPL